MNDTEFMVHVRDTRDQRPDLGHQRIFSALGVGGEAGEIVDLTKKGVYHELGFVHDDVVNEAGDLLFYVAWWLSTFGMTLGDAFEANQKKLAKRYPNGWVPGGGIR